MNMALVASPNPVRPLRQPRSDSHGYRNTIYSTPGCPPDRCTFPLPSPLLHMAETNIYKVSILGKQSIHCGFHLVPYIARTVLETLPASTYALITDTNLARLHLDAFQKGFHEEISRSGKNSRFLTYAIPPGETSKSREGKAAIEDHLLLNKCTRDTVVLALGGGVIGDLVGYVAATLCVLFLGCCCYPLWGSTHITARQHARRAFCANPNHPPGYG